MPAAAAPPAPSAPASAAPAPIPEVKSAPAAPTPQITPVAQPDAKNLLPASEQAGSHKSRLFEDMEKIASKDEGAKPDSDPKVETQAGNEEPQKTGAEDSPASAPVPAAGEKGKKVSPWKLVDQYKSKVAELEKQVAGAGINATAVQDKERLSARVQELQTKLNDYEQEFRFVNYAKTSEYQEKYQKPYEKAWKDAINEFKELTVEDGAVPGGVRPIAAQDLMEIVNLPLAKAREAAEAKFGSFADDIMGHRKEIRRLFEAQSAALEDAKKNGAERDRLRSEQMQQMTQGAHRMIGETWQKAGEEAVKHEKYGKYFAPVEGDQDGNQRLAKGFELVDRAFAENPLDPRLTPEQRQEIVRRHSAVRHRAAAFGRMVSQLEKAQTTIKHLTEELSQFKQSQPKVGGTQNGERASTARTRKDEIFGALDKLASR